MNPNPRRHDLDALRALAMLLGIALHAGLSFAPIPWIVQDTQQNSAFTVAFAAVHGFRMPLFFLLSGFFTAMLWRRRGLRAMLTQRAKRILLPLALGMATIVPLSFVVAMGAAWYSASVRHGPTPPEEITTLAVAAREGDLEAVRRFLKEDQDPNAKDPATLSTPLSRAALRADAAISAALLEAGANPNLGNAEKYTPLHDAAFVGADDVVALLLEAGADPHAVSIRGEKPLQSTEIDWGTTAFIARMFKIPLRDQEVVEAGRGRAAELLTEAMASTEATATDDEQEETAPETLREAYGAWLTSGAVSIPYFWTDAPDDGFDLINSALLFHLWFLWHLCWLVAAMAIYAAVGGGGLPRWLLVTPARWLLVVPVTLIPQYFMHATESVFGPDTSAGIVPYPHLLAYYAVFFFFGAAYYDADDTEGRADRYWWAELLLGLAVFAPALWLSREGQRPAADVLEVVFTWAMCFGLMGAFRRFLPGENRTIRYVSDSSYWLYLAHLPLVIVAQAMVVTWEAPAVVKFVTITVVSTAILLVSYRYLVRYTFLGRLLNGPRKRPEPAAIAAAASASP